MVTRNAGEFPPAFAKLIAVVTEELHSLLSNTFFSEFISEREVLVAHDKRLAHYTSADAALKIIDSKEMWLRKSATMNDFLEIAHGKASLHEAYERHTAGDKLKAALERRWPGICQSVGAWFETHLAELENNTYIACFSTHRPHGSEGRFGRLSMWRAYGGDAGVAFILKSAPFVSESDALKVYSHPVMYGDYTYVASHLGMLAYNIDENFERLCDVTQEDALGYLFWKFRSIVVCLKHEGFKEESEWRLVYTPCVEVSDRVRTEIETIRGIPQFVTKLPLKNYPEEGFIGAELNELIEKIIIGPTEHAGVLQEAFVAALKGAGVSNAEGRIVVSNIPLRKS